MRKLGFVDNMLLIASGMKRSLQAGLNAFLDETSRKKETYSKQAFSKGRQRIRPEAFKELSDGVVRQFYTFGITNTFKNFHALAIDGSRYNLPTNALLKAQFDVQITSGAEQVQALGSCLCDVLNGMIVDTRFGSCKDSERDHAADMILSLDESVVSNPLYLMDRGYPSAKLMALIEGQNQHYVMRCDPTFLRGIRINNADEIITHTFKKYEKPIRFRIITIQLESGTTEYLATNLFDESISIEDFKHLYHLRWGIESKYLDLKEKMQIENFTGATPIAVRQDYYATLFLANLCGAMAYDYRDEIEAIHNKPENKHTYKLNINLTIAALKDHVVEMLLISSPRKRTFLFNRILRRLQSAVVPIRPDRKEPRIRRHKLSKYPMNSKKP